MAPPPLVVAALLGALLAQPGLGAVPRPRRALVYFTQHPTGTSTSTRTSDGASSSSYFATGPEVASLAPAFQPGVPAGPAASAFPQGLPAGPAPAFPQGLQTLQDLVDQQQPDNSPYGDVPPPPPPPPGPAPPYTVNAARGLTYESASQAPPLRASYAPSPRISYGRVGVLARVGYTAPSLAVAAPALLLTNAKDGGLAGTEAPPPPQPFDPYSPAFAPFAPPPPPPPQSYSPSFAAPLAPSFRPQGPRGLFGRGRGGRVFRPSPPDPSAAFGAPVDPNQFSPLLGPPPPGLAPNPFDPLAPQQPPPADVPATNPADQTPQRFVQSFVPPPVSPILLSRNRGGDSYYLGGVSNFLR